MKNEFEKYPKLAEYLQGMATTGKTGTPTEWGRFLGELNKVLRQYCVSGTCQHNNMQGHWCMDCGYDSTGNYH